AVEGERAGLARLIARLPKRLAKPAASFAHVPSHVPEHPQCSREPQRPIGIAVVQRPPKRLPQVVVLVVEPSQPPHLLPAAYPRFGLLGERQKVLRVPEPHSRLVRVGREPLERVGANGLEHRVAWFAVVADDQSYEALVDERSKRVEY